jgi:hypothetical protein
MLQYLNAQLGAEFLLVGNWSNARKAYQVAVTGYRREGWARVLHSGLEGEMPLLSSSHALCARGIA